MNDHDKSPDQAQQDEYARELGELLNLLETVDRRITPGHIAQRFGDLLEDMGDGGPPVPPVPALEAEVGVSGREPPAFEEWPPPSAAALLTIELVPSSVELGWRPLDHQAAF